MLIYGQRQSKIKQSLNLKNLLIYQSDRCQVINNVIFNAKYGIVSTLAKDFAVIYNTVFNNQFASAETDTCLYVELQKDRGNGVLDYGKATIFNNIFLRIKCIAQQIQLTN